MRARVTLAALTSALPCILALGTEGGEAKREDARPASRFTYLPPDIEDRVVFYHSFERGVARPEINDIKAQVTCGKRDTAPGLTGRGLRVTDAEAAKTPLRLRSPELSPHKGITVSLWWRPDAKMKHEACYHLITLSGRGYLGSFIRGKGGWCALKEPTFVFQCYNFPGIANMNHVWTGSAWADEGSWHHIAMTVSLGSDVRVYWDGKLRLRHSAKGRAISKADAVQQADLGPSWLYHPMTLDEVAVFDRALTAGEIADYVTAVKKLAEVKFTSVVPDDGKTDDAPDRGERDGNRGGKR